MVEKQHYRWDFVGLSTDTKPTPETSEKVVNGSTYYESDTSKLYVFCDTEWYERQPLGGGGGGSDINVVQTTGQSTTDVMSQKAVTDALTEAGESVHELTEDDYNFDYGNSGTYNTVALWLLEPGLYTKSMGSTVRVANYNYGLLGEGYTFLVTAPMGTGTNAYRYIYYTGSGSAGSTSAIYVRVSNGSFSETYSGKFFNGDVVNNTGTSMTNVMSQNAVTSMVFGNPGTNTAIKIGTGAQVDSEGVSIGRGARGVGGSVAIGRSAGYGGSSANDCRTIIGYEAGKNPTSNEKGSISLGAYSKTSVTGEMNIGSTDTNYGYNNTNYRLLTGLHDPVDAHDAATKGYVDANIGYNFYSQAVQSALEDPEVPKSLPMAEYEALEGVCANLGKLYFAYSSGNGYYSRDDIINYECNEGTGINIYGQSEAIAGSFSFEYNGGEPTVVYSPSQI